MKQNFGGRWMPECSDKYELFYREYYWSPAYKHFDTEGLTKRGIYDKKTNRFITHAEITTIGYLWEAEEDYSKETSFTVSCLQNSYLMVLGCNMQMKKGYS